LKGGRLLQFRGNLAVEFVAADAFADRQLEPLPDGTANGLGDVQRGFARAGQVEIALVNGADLDVRGEIVDVRKHEPGTKFLFYETTRQKDKPWAQTPRHNRGHGGVDAKFASFIGGGGNDAAFLAAHGHRFAAQPRVGRLFHRSKESI